MSELRPDIADFPRYITGLDASVHVVGHLVMINGPGLDDMWNRLLAIEGLRTLRRTVKWGDDKLAFDEHNETLERSQWVPGVMGTWLTDGTVTIVTESSQTFAVARERVGYLYKTYRERESGRAKSKSALSHAAVWTGLKLNQPWE